MSSSQEKKALLKFINNIFVSAKWKVEYGYMVEIRQIPTRIYKISFRNIFIIPLTADDVNFPTAIQKRIFELLDENGLLRPVCQLKRRKNS